jgi:CheY-like chemotaxis protein
MSAKAAVDRPALVILVAEDDPNDVLLLRRAFSRAGIVASLFFVPNGQEAISYLRGERTYEDRSKYPVPHMVLLDLNMPAVGGLDVLEWLASRPERAELVVVVFSSCMAPSDCRQAAMLGAHSCMTKPIDPSALLPVLAELSRNPHPGARAQTQENCAPQARRSS